MKNQYFKVKVISTNTFHELDNDLHDFVGIHNFDDYGKIIQITEDHSKDIFYRTYGSTPIEIDILIEFLENSKKDGANFVEIENNIDNFGYDISTLRVSRADQEDIDKCEEESRSKSEKRKQKEIEELKNRLKELEK
jgi:hypothetical protein